MDNYGSKWREVGMLPSPRYGLRGATLGKSLISKFSFLNLFYCASIPFFGGMLVMETDIFQKISPLESIMRALFDKMISPDQYFY